MRMNRVLGLTVICCLFVAAPLCAREELVTLPVRDKVTLTIYREVDLTMVREERTLSFSKGKNTLQFSWANTLIDPSSVRFDPIKANDGLEVIETSYPKESGEMLTWIVEAAEAGHRGVVISYFTSGISWSASYDARLNQNGDSMQLTGYVTVNNLSGEEYENASVRLIIGSLHLVEAIRELAQRAKWNVLRDAVATLEKDGYPQDEANAAEPPEAPSARGQGFGGKILRARAAGGGGGKPNEVQKEAIGEYFMYTLEDPETIPNGWSKRLTAIKPRAVKTAQVYYWKPSEFGRGLMRVIEFKNTKEHGLDSKNPLPGGLVQVYADADDGALGYISAVSVKYVPYGEEAKWNLGSDPNVTMNIVTMKERRRNLNFNADLGPYGMQLQGWDQENEVEIVLANRRAYPITVELHMRYNHADYEFSNTGDGTKEDAFTTKWRKPMEQSQELRIPYTVTFHNGSNARRK